MSKNETELSMPLDESQYEWVELPSKGKTNGGRAIPGGQKW